MKPILIIFFMLLGLNLFSTYVQADIDVYEFSSEENRERYLGLTKELRCPKCQNQDIADSNAPIAQDMRREVHRLVEEGKEHGDVVSFMVERFGDFVTYKPKIVPSTYLLWFGPIILIAIGLIVVIRQTSKKRAASNQAEKNVEGMSESKRQQLDSLLSRYDETDGESKNNHKGDNS